MLKSLNVGGFLKNVGRQHQTNLFTTAQSRPRKQKMERIDVHAHIVPDGWRKYSIQYGYENPDGMPAIPVSMFFLPNILTNYLRNK